MNRKIESISFVLGEQQVVHDPIAAIKKQAKVGRYSFLLAHGDDGVVWGFIKESDIKQAVEAFPDDAPTLRAHTLWEARLFGKSAEWYLWKQDDQWFAREIRDYKTPSLETVSGRPTTSDTFTESFILWGTDMESEQGSFTMAREADLGIRHAVPIAWNGRHNFRLQVRHYLDYDDAGVVFTKLSRLVQLTNGGKS